MNPGYKALLFFLLLSLLRVHSPAQDPHKIDSLLKVLPTLKEDTNKVLALYSLGWEISYNSLTEGLKYAAQAEELALRLNYQYGLSRAYHDMGSIYLDLGNFEKANEYLYKELRILEKTDRTASIAACYIELGILYSSQRNLSKALMYDTLARRIYLKRGYSEAVIASNINIASLYSDMKDYRKALEINQTDLELLRMGIGSKEQLASTYISIGELNIHLQNRKEGLANLMAGYKIFRKEGLTYFLPHALGAIGRFYLESDKPRIAIAYFDSSLTLLNQTGQRQIQIDAYSNLSDCYEAIGDYKHAHAYYKLYSSLKDSVFNDLKVKEITQNEMKYEFDKVQQAEKLKQEKKQAVEDLKQKRDHLAMYALGAGFLALLVIMFIVLRGYREKKKVNLELEHKNTLIEEKNKSITDSINYAKRIQDAILPSDKTVLGLLPASFILFKPKDIVSGDFYWVEKTGKKIFFTAVDCTGHGVPGAMVSVVGHNNLNRCIKEFSLTQPAAILDKLNELVQETFAKGGDEVRDGMDLALCVLDTDTLVLEYAGANNPLWICRRENNAWQMHEIRADKQPIGKYATRKAFTAHSIQLKKGESIYLFSDGYADQFGGEKGKKFKYKNLKELILSLQEKSMPEQKQVLLDHFIRWQKDLEQVDDVLVIGVRI